MNIRQWEEGPWHQSRLTTKAIPTTRLANLSLSGFLVHIGVVRTEAGEGVLALLLNRNGWREFLRDDDQGYASGRAGRRRSGESP